MSQTSVDSMLTGLDGIRGVFDNNAPNRRPARDYGNPSPLFGPPSQRQSASDMIDEKDTGQSGSVLGDMRTDSLYEQLDWGPDSELAGIEDAVAERLGGRLDADVQHEGIDALAWYVPFHTRDPRWGIHIPVSSIAHLARVAFHTVAASRQIRWMLAFRALHAHEFNHFAVEYFCGIWELLHGVPCWSPSERALPHPRHGYILDEERLANAQALRVIRRGGAFDVLAGKTEGFRDYMKRQPVGYRGGRLATADSKFFPLIEKVLSARIKKSRTYDAGRHGRLTLRSLVSGFPALAWQGCPVHLYHDRWHTGAPESAMWFIGAIHEPITETRTFRDQLERLEPAMQRRWLDTKRKLAHSTQLAGLNFKRWPPPGSGVYSVRLSDSHRAHLRRDRIAGEWIAEAVGGHAEMGHG